MKFSMKSKLVAIPLAAAAIAMAAPAAQAGGWMPRCDGKTWQCKSGHQGASQNETVVVRSRTWDGNKRTYVKVGGEVETYRNRGWQTQYTWNHRTGGSSWKVVAPLVNKAGTYSFTRLTGN